MKSRLLVVAAAVAAVPVFAPTAAAGGGGCHGDFRKDARGAEVAMTQACLDPLVVRVDPGQTVTWTNKDQMPHNLVGAGFRWGQYDNIPTGGQLSYRFAKAGTFPYVCTVHPAMVGAVVVGDGVLADVADFEGSVTGIPVTASSPAAATSTTVSSSAVSSSEAAAAPVGNDAAPTPVQQISPVAAAASRPAPDDGGSVPLALFAGIGALVLAGVALLARRQPAAASRELVG